MRQDKSKLQTDVGEGKRAENKRWSESLNEKKEQEGAVFDKMETVLKFCEAMYRRSDYHGRLARLEMQRS